MAVPPHALGPTLDKTGLRSDLRRRRREFVASLEPATRVAAIAEITTRVIGRLPRKAVVALYLPIDAEVDTLPLIERLGRVALPCIGAAKAPLVFRAWSVGEPLTPTRLGVSQPCETAPVVDPDVFITPLVGVDDALTRLGYGGGYYDRAFAAFPNAYRIGLAWSVQCVPYLPRDPWDMPLHAVATEQDWITT